MAHVINPIRWRLIIHSWENPCGLCSACVSPMYPREDASSGWNVIGIRRLQGVRDSCSACVWSGRFDSEAVNVSHPEITEADVAATKKNKVAHTPLDSAFSFGANSVHGPVWVKVFHGARIAWNLEKHASVCFQLRVILVAAVVRRSWDHKSFTAALSSSAPRVEDAKMIPHSCRVKPKGNDCYL